MNIIQLSMFDGKVCRTCNNWVSFSGYYSNGSKGADCKECEKAKKRERRAIDPTWDREVNRRARAKRPDVYRESNRKSYKKHQANTRERINQDRKSNPEKYRKLDRERHAANSEKFCEYQRKYRSVNREKRNAWNHVRRAKSRSGGRFTPEQWKLLCDWFDNKCLVCGSENITVDHVVPLSMGGKNTIDNLQPLCNPCNNKKHAKIIDYRDPVSLLAFLEHIQCLEPIDNSQRLLVDIR